MLWLNVKSEGAVSIPPLQWKKNVPVKASSPTLDQDFLLSNGHIVHFTRCKVHIDQAKMYFYFARDVRQPWYYQIFRCVIVHNAFFFSRYPANWQTANKFTAVSIHVRSYLGVCLLHWTRLPA